MRPLWLGTLALMVAACTPQPEYDIVLRNGLIYDGSGSPAMQGDVAIQGDRIVEIGKSITGRGREEINVFGLAVAPGFINMLSQADDSLVVDGRSQSDIRQGVTLEIFGEGTSQGPLNGKMKEIMLKEQGDLKYDIKWTTLSQYLDYLVQKGVSPNVASFVGATTVRIHEVGYQDRVPTPEELDRMRALVRQAMEQGALGLGSSLIYAPAFYAKTPELIELAKAASEYGGIYISHMRSEGNRLLEAIDEVITIAKEANIPAEIYHLKAAGQSNWPKLSAAIEKIEKAQADGLKITADMYTYTAGSTGLDAAMPPWVQEGGYEAWAKRLRDPAIRAKVRREMSAPADQWENLRLAAGSEGTLVVGFKNDKLKPLTGKTLAELAKMRGTSPEETAMDLVVEDGSRVQVVYFLMSEDNVKRQIALPWVSFCSDAGSMAPEGVFIKSSTHPRAYGSFARLLGKYVRDENVISFEEAVRKLSGLPAKNLGLQDRGTLTKGNFADVVVFDPTRIKDNATYEKPHQFAAGMVHVFVNGKQVLKNGEHTGATPGRVVRGRKATKNS